MVKARPLQMPEDEEEIVPSPSDSADQFLLEFIPLMIPRMTYDRLAEMAASKGLTLAQALQQAIDDFLNTTKE